MLTTANSSLTFFMDVYKQNMNWENNWRRNVIQNITNHSPSKYLQSDFWFQSYSQKHYRSRRQYLEKHYWVKSPTLAFPRLERSTSGSARGHLDCSRLQVGVWHCPAHPGDKRSLVRTMSHDFPSQGATSLVRTMLHDFRSRGLS